MKRKKSKLSETSFKKIKEYIKRYNLNLTEHDILNILCKIALELQRSGFFQKKAKQVVKNSKNRNAEWGFIKGCEWLENEINQSLGCWID